MLSSVAPFWFEWWPWDPRARHLQVASHLSKASSDMTCQGSSMGCCIYCLPFTQGALMFPSWCKFCASVCVSRLIQDSAGRSRCRLVTQIHTRRPASPSGAPFVWPNKLKPSGATHRYYAPNALPKHTHARTHSGSTEASQDQWQAGYII